MAVTESDSLQKKWYLLHSYSKPSTVIHIQEHYSEMRDTKYKLLFAFWHQSCSEAPNNAVLALRHMALR